jgi:branched-chain amino acid transport system substrate-binding protein
MACRRASAVPDILDPTTIRIGCCRTLALAMVPLLALVAACLASPAARAADAVPGVTDSTIKIGMFGPLTGTNSLYGYPINDGAVAYYKYVNDHGGINGRKIEVIDEDDGCDVARTRAAVKKLIDRDNVFMVHGGNCSATTLAVRDEFIEDKVPFMVMAATLDKISVPVSHYIFTTTLLGPADGKVMLGFMKSIPNIKKVAIIKHENDWADAKAKDILDGVKAAGLDVVAQVQLDSGAKDATSQVLSIKAAKPDATFFVLYPGESAVFLRDALKYGLAGPFVGTTAVSDLGDLIQRAGSPDAVKNVFVGSFLGGPVDSPEMKPYADIVQTYFPKDKLTSLPFAGMSGAYAVVAALRAAGRDLTREKFIAALEAQHDADVGPAFCKVTFTPQDHVGCKTSTMWTMENGKIVNIGPVWKAPGAS